MASVLARRRLRRGERAKADADAQIKRDPVGQQDRSRAECEPQLRDRRRAFELSEGSDPTSAVENWLRAEHELAVAHDYDTVDRDLEQAGMTISRLPLEAGVVWRLCLPRGECIEEWEPGNAGLTLPARPAVSDPPGRCASRCSGRPARRCAQPLR